MCCPFFTQNVTFSPSNISTILHNKNNHYPHPHLCLLTGKGGHLKGEDDRVSTTTGFRIIFVEAQGTPIASMFSTDLGKGLKCGIISKVDCLPGIHQNEFGNDQ